MLSPVGKWLCTSPPHLTPSTSLRPAQEHHAHNCLQFLVQTQRLTSFCSVASSAQRSLSHLPTAGKSSLSGSKSPAHPGCPQLSVSRIHKDCYVDILSAFLLLILRDHCVPHLSIQSRSPDKVFMLQDFLLHFNTRFLKRPAYIALSSHSIPTSLQTDFLPTVLNQEAPVLGTYSLS